MELPTCLILLSTVYFAVANGLPHRSETVNTEIPTEEGGTSTLSTIEKLVTTTDSGTTEAPINGFGEQSNESFHGSDVMIDSGEQSNESFNDSDVMIVDAGEQLQSTQTKIGCNDIQTVRTQSDNKVNCFLCKKVIDLLRTHIPIIANKEEFKEFWSSLCQEKTMKDDKCMKYVDEHYSQIFDLLKNDSTSEVVWCQYLKACPKYVFLGDLKQNSIHTSKLSLSSPKISKREIISNIKEFYCRVCKTVNDWAKNLTGKFTKEQVVKSLSELCEFLPSLVTQCKEFVEKNIPHYYSMLTGLPLNVVCMSLCGEESFS